MDPDKEIEAAFDDLEALLKNGDVIQALTQRGINASIALLAAHGLRAYLAGRKEEAAEDLSTAAEEIQGRIAAAPAAAPGNGRGDGVP